MVVTPETCGHALPGDGEWLSEQAALFGQAMRVGACALDCDTGVLVFKDSQALVDGLVHDTATQLTDEMLYEPLVVNDLQVDTAPDPDDPTKLVVADMRLIMWIYKEHGVHVEAHREAATGRVAGYIFDTALSGYSQADLDGFMARMSWREERMRPRRAAHAARLGLPHFQGVPAQAGRT